MDNQMPIRASRICNIKILQRARIEGSGQGTNDGQKTCSSQQFCGQPYQFFGVLKETGKLRTALIIDVVCTQELFLYMAMDRQSKNLVFEGNLLPSNAHVFGVPIKTRLVDYTCTKSRKNKEMPMSCSLLVNIWNNFIFLQYFLLQTRESNTNHA